MVLLLGLSPIILGVVVIPFIWLYIAVKEKKLTLKIVYERTYISGFAYKVKVKKWYGWKELDYFSSEDSAISFCERYIRVNSNPKIIGNGNTKR